MPNTTQPPDTVTDNLPDTIATPEGDNEFAPDQPLKPSAEATRPRGDEPHSEQPIRNATE